MKSPGAVWEAATGAVPKVLVRRSRILEPIAGALAGTCGKGALVLGEPGAGKTTAARQVLTQLADDVHVERVRGGPLVAGIPYGAVHYLLSELEVRQLEHPFRIAAGTAGLLRRRAAGRPAVVFVDNAHLLDQQSAAMLSQLAFDGTARLLVCSEDVASTPPVLVDLWKNGSLARTDVEGFTLAETAGFLRRTLGAPVTHRAVYELWEASGGNPLLLGVLLREWKRGGRLAHAHGAWMPGTGRSRPGNGLGTIRPAKLAGLSGQQQALLDILACLGTVPSRLLRALGSDADYDELQRRGLAESAAGGAAVPSRLLREVVRRRTARERSGELLRRVVDAGAWDILGTGGREASGALLALAEWTLACGAGLEPGQALQAARCSLELSRPQAALRFIELVPDHQALPAAVVLHIRSQLAQGQIRSAAAVLDRYDDEGGGRAAGADWLDLAIARSQVARALRGRAAEAGAHLAEAEQRLAAPAADGPARVRLQRGQLVLAQAELALFEGRFRDVPACLSGGPSGSSGREFGARTAALLAETWAGTGQADQAGRLVEELTGTGHPEGPAAGRGELADQLGRSFASQRMWDGWAATLAARGQPGLLAGSALWLQADIARAMVLAEDGKLHNAVRLLAPVLAQLDAGGHELLRPLAYAAAAYLHALAGDSAATGTCLAVPVDDQLLLPWRTEVSVRYYSAMARATVAGFGAAAAELAHDARRARERGAFADALYFLSGAVRLGRSGSLPELVDAARKVEGPFARTCLAFGTGLQQRDPALLLAAAGSAADDGAGLFSREAARLALTLASSQGDPATMRAAQKYIYAHSGSFDFAIGQCGGGQALTAREREMAELVAANQPNSAIARHFGISVRTVEGHLHKLYSKLQLRHSPVLEAAAHEEEVPWLTRT